jgi:hypothetical protein
MLVVNIHGAGKGNVLTHLLLATLKPWSKLDTGKIYWILKNKNLSVIMLARTNRKRQSPQDETRHLNRWPVHQTLLESTRPPSRIYPIIKGASRPSQRYIEPHRRYGRHLCAWGNDAVSEVLPRRVNCWLKTISNPPAVLARAPQNFW